jgi:hypothetical protein
MADNVTANSGTGGAVFASDDIGGVQFPRVKLVHGADGVNAGDVAAANPLPAKLSDGTNAVAVKAASTAAVATDPALVVAVSPNAGLALDATLTGGTAKAISTGNVAHDAADSGSPVKVGGKAASALPTAVSNADRADALTDTYGRLMICHIDPAMQIWKSFNATTTQTGVAVWTPASGKKVVITALQIGSYGATAARLILWFGASGDTTYTEGTDQPVIKQSFAPSANGFPGLLLPTHTAIYATTVDHVLRVTTDAALSFDITVFGYEV